MYLLMQVMQTLTQTLAQMSREILLTGMPVGLIDQHDHADLAQASIVCSHWPQSGTRACKKQIGCHTF